MANENIKKMLTDGYNSFAFTHHYIMGYRLSGIVYFTFCEAKDLDNILTLDKASRGQGYSLRFKPNKAQKAILATMGATALCSCEYFDEMVACEKYNKGEIFEKLVTEFFGQFWEKDNIPYTMAGDIEIDGIAYQIKYEKATFTNEKTLFKMMSEKSDN